MVDGNLLWKSMLWKFILWTFLWEYVEQLRVVELNVVGYNRSYKLLINKEYIPSYYYKDTYLTYFQFALS